MARADVQDVAGLKIPAPKGVEIPVASPAYLRGPQVLSDPGFEGFIRRTGPLYPIEDREALLGDSTFVLPFFDSSCPQGQRWETGTCVEGFSPWYQRNGTYVVDDATNDTGWKVSNFDPQAGAWHAIWWNWQAEPALGHPALLAAQGFNHHPGTTARCSSGDTITWSIYCYASETTNTPYITLWLSFFGTNPLYALANVTQTTALTATYTKYEVVTGAPSGSYTVRAMIDFEGTGTAKTFVCADTAVLGVE
jgi:hypothetical protein